jgi:DDE superfamily endonuclease
MEEAIAVMIVMKIFKHRSDERQRQLFFDSAHANEDETQEESSTTTLTCYQSIISDQAIRTALRVFVHAASKRYVFRRGRRHKPIPINKFDVDLNPSPVHPNDTQPWLNEIEFINAYRMTRKAFQLLVSKIKDHPVFKRGKRGFAQVSVKHQLMTLLHYLSSPGSSASGNRTRNHFLMSYGSKDKYIQRCVKAIRGCLRDQYYTWPDANERATLGKEFLSRYGLPNAIGLVDGTTFRLLFKPKRQDAADYSGRKEGYTITNLFFTDIHRKVRYYVSGWAGCAHDNRMWKNCQLFLNPSQFFSPGEYLLGDSAFDNGSHMITTYRVPTGGALTGSKKKFNDLISSPRVISEHVNGILKGRWSWLNCIPNVLDENTKSMKKILLLIDVVVILHNFLTEHNLNEDDKYFYNAEEHDFLLLDHDDELNRPVNPEAPSGTRREQLRAYLSEQGIL